MLSHTIKASRQGVARLARQHAASTRRAFAATTQRQADIVQDIYIRELKNYKTPAVKASDSEGQVKKFAAPAAPKSPEEGDLAGDLKTYESQQPELVGQSSETGSSEEKFSFFEELDEEIDAVNRAEKEDNHH